MTSMKFTTFERPKVSLGGNLRKAIAIQRDRLDEFQRFSGLRAGEWEGVILKGGVPVYSVSYNGVVWKLTRVYHRDYNKLSDYQQVVNHRAVWFGNRCEIYRTEQTNL